MSDFKKQNFETEIGQKAKVEQTKVDNELSAHANSALRQIGEFINPQVGDELEYMGSAAVHIYQSRKLKHMVFQAQAPLGYTPETTASIAMEPLKGEMMNYYGRLKPTKRSGF